MKDFIKELKKANGYDAIANNGYKYSNYELVSIIKEALFLVYSDYKNEINYKEFEAKLADALIEWYELEEEFKELEEEKPKEKTKKFYVWIFDKNGKKKDITTIESNKTKEEIKADLILQGVEFDGVDVVR